MAKLKGPLFSLGATQKLADTLVYYSWKGLNCVREYVIPANPKTTAQTTQRGYLESAVNDIHTAMAEEIAPLTEDDKTAYALWASVVKAATTWFNQAVKNWIDVTIAGKTPTVYRGGVSSPGSELIHPNIRSSQIDGSDITAGKFYYGTSKTALINSETAVIATQEATATLSLLTPGVKYFVQFRPDPADPSEGARSGIYHGVPTA